MNMKRVVAMAQRPFSIFYIYGNVLFFHYDLTVYNVDA